MRPLLFLVRLAGVAAAVGYANNDQQVLRDPTEVPKTPCDLLAASFHGQVVTPDDLSYNASQAKYWTAQQSELRPACHFLPKDARDIQIALAEVLIPHNVSFAVASGGHSTNIGASNINDSVTINLSRLNHITLVDNNESVLLGSGARWGDVYSTLEAVNRSVPGARVSDVGVGGFILGGGLSWFAHQHGWACDSVLEFEVVTPNAEILHVNKAANEDLFWALKGSLGAFGIVTSIKMPTIPNKYVYAGGISYHWRFVPRILHALQNLSEQATTDPATQGYLSFAWLESESRFVYNAYLMNTEGQSWNDALASFKVIHPETRTLRMTTLGDSAAEINSSNPRGLRRTKFTLTCQSSYETMMALHELVKARQPSIAFDADSILGVTFQPLTLPHLRRQEAHARSNIFTSLDASAGPLLLVSVEFWWGSAGRDAYFEAQARQLHEALRTAMADRGVLHPWLYPNDAHRSQHPFAAPAPAPVPMDPRALRVLRRVSRKYDPDRLWPRLVPGIWHI